ncbi:acetyl-CoA carboxylase biotin carboxyl carrier protein [Gluconacetobacter sp. SXCC-1]|nr:acetyl-CoA carboxylase biotin carboxyl carrier protein [Gluconacetobacter sp. SXCC-1]
MACGKNGIMNNAPKLIPAFDTLPDPDEIARIAGWLADAGLESLELSNDAGIRLLIRVPQAAQAEEGQDRLPAPARLAEAVDTVAATAPYFGHLCLTHPLRDVPFAPVGAQVSRNDVVALLTLESLQLPVRAPVSGEVVDVVAQPGALLGYGAKILEIRPDHQD